MLHLLPKREVVDSNAEIKRRSNVNASWTELEFLSQVMVLLDLT